MHRQSRKAWERHSTELESTNKRYLIRLIELLAEKDALELVVKDERNTALLAAVQLTKENCFLRAQNHKLKEKAAQAFTSPEALNEVIDTSKSWAVEAFEMLAEADDVPRYERGLKFQESLHKAALAGEEPSVFEESSEDDEDEEVANLETQADETVLPDE